MIISDEHGYLFIEAPHTGSTAVAAELREHYDGTSILHKHANYREYQRQYGDRRDLYVFSAVRNPLDEIVSLYVKFLNNHKSNFTDESKFIENGGWITEEHRKRFRYVQQEDHDFNDFFVHFYRLPYTHHIDYNSRYCDYVMRFEHLNDDFRQVMENIGMDLVRSLPKKNPTAGKRHYTEYFDGRGIRHAIKTLTPYMEQWGYSFPNEWDIDYKCPLKSYVLYHLQRMVITYASKYYKYGPLRRIRAWLPNLG